MDSHKQSEYDSANRRIIYRSLSTSNYVSTPSQLTHSIDTQYETPAEQKSLSSYIQYNNDIKTESPNSIHIVDNDLTHDIYSTPLDRNITRIRYQSDDKPLHTNKALQSKQQSATIYQWYNCSVTLPIPPPSHPVKTTTIKILSILGLPVPQINQIATNPLIQQLHATAYKSFDTDTVHGTVLLQPCSGAAHSGRLLGIMGSSGCGKTTLLNLLSGRGVNNTTAQVTGTTTINNKYINTTELLQQCSYITQDDYLHSTATVYESIEFSARVRELNHNNNINKHVLNIKINQMLKQLDLQHCCHRQIGNTMNNSSNESQSVGTIDTNNGLSGGQIRRTSVGIELINNNTILLCDEITSGLDSTTSYNIVKLLKQIALENKVVLCTIHSPSNKIFQLFDDIILMCHGYIVYNGPRNDMLDWFSALGYEIPNNCNPAEWIVDLLKIENELDVQRVRHLLSARAGQQNIKTIDTQNIQIEHANNNTTTVLKHDTMTFYCWLLQLMLLLTREFKSIYRQPYKLALRFLQIIGLAIFIGMVYNNTNNTQAGVFGRIGYLFFSLCIFALITTSSTVYDFVSTKLLLLYECNTHNYSITAYFISKTIYECVIQFALALLFTCISYYMVQLKDTTQAFGDQLVALTILSWTCHSVSLILSALISDTFVASVAAPLTIVPFMLFSGFFINVTTIPVYISWFQWLSPHLYIFKAIVVNQFLNLHIICTPDELVDATVYSTHYEFCALSNGSDVLNLVSFNGPTATYKFNIGICVLLCVVYRIIALLCLQYVCAAHKQTNQATNNKTTTLADKCHRLIDYLTAKQNILQKQ